MPCCWFIKKRISEFVNQLRTQQNVQKQRSITCPYWCVDMRCACFGGARIHVPSCILVNLFHMVFPPEVIQDVYPAAIITTFHWTQKESRSKPSSRSFFTGLSNQCSCLQTNVCFFQKQEIARKGSLAYPTVECEM